MALVVFLTPVAAGATSGEIATAVRPVSAKAGDLDYKETAV